MLIIDEVIHCSRRNNTEPYSLIELKLLRYRILISISDRCNILPIDIAIGNTCIGGILIIGLTILISISVVLFAVRFTIIF